jgi:hypothetical protein
VLTNLSYCQYPKTKVIDGEKIVMLTKVQADDINLKFVKFRSIIDSQKIELSKPVKIDTVVIIKDDTDVTKWKTYYKGKLKECYDANIGLTKWYKETQKTAMFLDTCNYRRFRKKYKELEKIRKNRYN